jgi:hypothetical protein
MKLAIIKTGGKQYKVKENDVVSIEKLEGAARNTSWNTYKTDTKKAGYDLKTAKKAAWEAFKAASKGCKTSVVESEPTLGISL